MRPVTATTFIAALASLAVGGVHLATGGPHLQESVPLGVAFIVTGWLQIMIGAVVWGRPSRMAAVALTAVHVASIGAWAVSRSVGLPFGHPGGAPFGVGGVTAVALEGLAIVALASFIRHPAYIRRLPTIAALGAVTIMLGGASVAVADVATGHAAPSADAAPSDHHAAPSADAAPSDHHAADGHEDTAGPTRDMPEDSHDGHEDSRDGQPHAEATEEKTTDLEHAATVESATPGEGAGPEYGVGPDADSDDAGDDGEEGHGGDGHDH